LEGLVDINTERNRVSRSFHRGASEYDENTPVQQRVVDSLVNRVAALSGVPAGEILDIGCGTGRLVEQLLPVMPDRKFSGIDLASGMIQQAELRLKGRACLMQGDAEKLPVADGSCAVVLSSSTFQWLNPLDCCFGEVKRVLVENGWFCFAMFGSDTLYELKESWQVALKQHQFKIEQGRDGTRSFHSGKQVKTVLENCGFRDIAVETTIDKVYYPDVAHLLQAVKRIGAGSSRPIAGGGLGWRKVLHNMAEYYTNKYGTSKGVPASYEIIWGLARR
jgi:malonyl-CoA O-methyltransferase